MLRMSRTCSAAVVVAFALSACGGDSTSPEPEINEAASLEIATELLFTVFTLGLVGFSTVDGVDGADAADAGVGLLSAAILSGQFPVETINETVPCQQGGTIGVAGTIEDNFNEEGIGTFAMDLRQTPNNCGMTTSQGLFTINGNPDLRILANITVTEGSEFDTFTMSFNGGFTWAGSGGNGSCTVNFSYNLNYQNPALSTVTGSLCGHNLSSSTGPA